MARINPNQMENYSTGSDNEWFKLENDGDVARVQFLYNNYNDLDVFACHTIQTGETYKNGNPVEKYVDCKRNYDDPVDMCPFCQAGMKVKPVMYVSMYDHNDKKVKIWERGRKFRDKLDAMFNRYSDLTQMVFEIERHGAKGDQQTTYEVFPMPEVEPLDVSEINKPDFIGGIILDKTVDEMQTYLDTGSFPNTDEKPQGTQRATRTQSAPTMRSEQVTPRASRGGSSRRGEQF